VVVAEAGMIVEAPEVVDMLVEVLEEDKLGVVVPRVGMLEEVAHRSSAALEVGRLVEVARQLLGFPEVDMLEEVVH